MSFLLKALGKLEEKAIEISAERNNTLTSNSYFKGEFHMELWFSLNDSYHCDCG